MPGGVGFQIAVERLGVRGAASEPLARMGVLPLNGPVPLPHPVPVIIVVAVVVRMFCQILSAFRVIRLNIGKVVENPPMLPAEAPDLLIALVQTPLDARPVEMSGHVHEIDVRILPFQFGQKLEIGIDVSLRSGAHLPAP